MILDFNYNKYKKELGISYITERGGKALLKFKVPKFKSYIADPAGQYTNWDGRKCSIKYIDKPGSFEYYTFIHELPEYERNLVLGKYVPKLYTWDIETQYDPTEFPDPNEARFPITTISSASPELNVFNFGTKELSSEDINWVQDQMRSYLKKSDFYNSLELKSEPTFQYKQFNNEEAMIGFFLHNIIAKAPVLAGWNSEGFDSLYLQNRITNNYSNLNMNQASLTNSCSPKRRQDKRGNKYVLRQPDHTLMVDMMDVVENFDLTLGNKESLSLDYIAKLTVGIGKIEYDGDLEKLRQSDYRTYIFYSCIDSILVQLISMKLRTMNNIYAQALYCKTKISEAFSKIRVSEALVFDYFYNKGIKVVPDADIWSRERPDLVGAYVREPSPGKFKYVCCNDFSGLYPSCIATCNLSFENYIGSIRDGKFQSEQDLEVYKKDPNYFVSVNGSVYKNDKDYAFKEIQVRLRNERDFSKYASKSLYANILQHAKNELPKNSIEYNKDDQKVLTGMGYDYIKCSDDIKKIPDLKKFIGELEFEIEHLKSYEQACKLLGNSMYGGSSHIAFFWFNIDLANDITGEGRNLIKLMEKHIPEYIDETWTKMTDFHNKLGIKIKDKYNDSKDIVSIIASDTDSHYICYENWVNSIEGSENMSIEQIRDLIVRFNLEFLDIHNKEFMDEYYKGRHCESIHNFELETIAYSDIRLDVKKRYCQMLLWVDGYKPDINNLKFKSKGLETSKASYPKIAREGLKSILIEYMMTDKEGPAVRNMLNNIVQIEKQKWLSNPDIQELCENKSINNYTKYIESDTDPAGLVVAPKCPYQVRALGNRNWTINTKPDAVGYELQYGGKMKIYPVKRTSKNKNIPDQYFAFMAGEYPKAWAEKYWPIDRKACFQKFYIDPLNRVLTSTGLKELEYSGDLSTDLFDSLF